MNRKQRRDFSQRAKKNGVDVKLTELYLAMDKEGLEKPSPANDIKEGDKVSVNVELVKARRNYDRMSGAYKQFVEDSVGKVFTAHVEQENMISMVEEPKWLFWSGDLVLVTE